MIVLHAGICDGRFLLWGETTEEHKPKRRGQKRKLENAVLLPYDAGLMGIQAGLDAVGIGIKVLKSNTDQAAVWLPSVGGMPIASSSLIAEPPLSKTKPQLTPYLVTAVLLTSEQIVDLLCFCQGKSILAPGVVVGQDMKFWGAALRFGGALVARQQYLPGIVRKEKIFYACWTPVISGLETNRLKRLVQAMPPICRALGKDEKMPPETPASYVFSVFIDAVVDHLVRTGSSGFVASKKLRNFDSLHDQWLHALQIPEGMLTGDAKALTAFADEVNNWQHPIRMSISTPFRLGFRMEEPDSVQGSWQMQYFLQSTEDPSLLIPAKEAWKKRGRLSALLKKDGFNATEYLLRSLGQAAGLCVHIEESLKTATPDGYVLDLAGAFEFLTEKSIALEQAGFGVLLPAWWTRKGNRQRLTARAKVKMPKLVAGGGLTMETLVQVDWEVALGGKKISLQELEALADLKAPLVQMRGQWVYVGADDIQAAIDFWKKKGNLLTLRDVIDLELGVHQLSDGFDFEGVQAHGDVGEFLSQLKGYGAVENLLPPEGFQGTLRPYQLRGYSWLAFLKQWGLGACLADDMGLGKTVQTLALILRDWKHKAQEPVLLVCPTSVVNNWEKEAAKFTPELPVMVHHGSGRQKGAAFQKAVKKQAIVVSSYALLQRDIENFKTVSWHGIILDEAQNIKNSETKQAQAARALQARYRIALTGTPVENNVGDLWSIMTFLNPGLLGSQAEFKRSFFVPIQAYRDAEAMARLKRRTGPFVLRRLKTDKTIISDLPDKMEMKVFCPLTKEQASLYAAVVEEALSDIAEAEGMERRGKIFSTLIRLKQICNHPAQFLGDNSSLPERSGKLTRLTEMLTEIIESGERALVFSQFAEMGGMLQKYFQDQFGQEIFFLHGGILKKRRDEMVTRFQESENSPSIFILSLKAGGTGLNLTRANHVFHFDRWWNPAVENQATDRVFRIGQTKNVQVHKFLCAGTLEERIDEMIERKKEVADLVVGTGEGWLTELSTDALKDLFTLDTNAIGE